MTDVIRRVADVVTIPFCVGGGIASFSDFERVLGAGADKVGINTAAVKNPELIKEVSDAFGSDKIVVAIDCKRRFEEGDGKTTVELEDGTQHGTTSSYTAAKNSPESTPPCGRKRCRTLVLARYC